MAIIEDDVYGELAYNYPRPRTIKSFDGRRPRPAVQLLLEDPCDRASRIWLGCAGRYLERVLQMKYISTGSTAPQPPIAIAEFLKAGHFEPHLRRMRRNTSAIAT